jgi:hypothetical protein
MEIIPPYVSNQRQRSFHQYSDYLNDNALVNISVYPGDQDYKENIIFDRSWILNSGWCEAMISLYEAAQAQSVRIGTSDVIPLEKADIIIFVNLPYRRHDVEHVRKTYPFARLVLIASESPIVQPHAAIHENHSLFDLIFAFSIPLHNFKYRILPPGCGYIPSPEPSFVPYAKRRFAILVNSNVNSGLLRSSRPWKVLEKYFEINQNGWHLPLTRFLKVLRNSRYHCRRSFARAAYKLRIPDFDIFGQGWEPLCSGWFYHFFPEKAWSNWRGPLRRDKLKVLANYKFAFCYENYEGNEMYVSEKIFDALAAGTVPLCLGDRKLQRWIPRECAVFRSDYPSDKDLLDDLLSWDEARWTSYRQAGQKFLHSERMKPFLPDTYAKEVLEGLISVLKS